jgi:hypothetical protein
MAAPQTSNAGTVTPLEETHLHEENRLTARSRFRHRHLHNWRKALFIFAPVALAFAVCIPTLQWYGDIVAGGVLWYLVFHVWGKETVWLRCNHCKKLIETNIPWICGFKQCRNENVDEYPFVHKCERCGAEPKAYQCHHKDCHKLIFLTNDEFEQNYARCTKPFKERSDLDIPGLEQDHQKAELELRIARVDKEMVGVNAGPDPDHDGERKRAVRLAKLDQQILLNKKKAELSNEKAKTKVAAYANLPLAERAKIEHDLKLERFAIADAGRALAKERYPGGGLNFDREMAHWEEFQERKSIGH